MRLYILIPSIPERKLMMHGLVRELCNQATKEGIDSNPVIINSTTTYNLDLWDNWERPKLEDYTSDDEIIVIVKVTEPHLGKEGAGSNCIGEKRNELKDLVRYMDSYFTFFDDDDWPEEDYIKEVWAAIKQYPDVVSINGTLVYASGLRCQWEMGLGYERKFIELPNNNGRTFYAPPNHLAVFKASRVNGYDFKLINSGEDTEWADRLRDEDVLKTEIRITKPIYRYVFTKQ